MQEVTITNKDGEQIILSNRAPFFLEKIDGVGEVPVVIESQKAPRQDGSTYIDNTLGERVLNIEGMILCDSKSLPLARRQLQKVLNPKLEEVIITYGGKEIGAIAESTPFFPGGRGSKGPRYQKFLLYLLCSDPLWRDPFFEGRDMSYLMGGLRFQLFLPSAFSFRGFSRKAVNEGDVAAPVEIEFKGPAVNPTVSNLTTGEFIKVNRGLGETDILSISTAFGKKHVHINGENAFHYIDLESAFWQLQPGENVLSYESNNDSVKTKVLVKWKNRYVGL